MDNLMKDFSMKSPNLALEKIILEKNLEIELQKRKFQEQVDDMTNRFESHLENANLQNKMQVQELKDQFLDIVIQLKEKFCKDIEGLQDEFRVEVERVQVSFEAMGDAKEGGDLEDDLQMIEELSSQFSRRQYAESDLDLSLKCLINQINLENDGSISDLLRN